MTFLDANYFLRCLVRSTTPELERRHDVAAAFEAIERGEEAATTSEAVLAEVAFVLAAKTHYNLPPAAVAAYLAPIIRLSGLRLPRGQKRRYLRALDLWAANPKLGFVNVLTAATVERTNLRLATFDADFRPAARHDPPVGTGRGRRAMIDSRARAGAGRASGRRRFTKSVVPRGRGRGRSARPTRR